MKPAVILRLLSASALLGLASLACALSAGPPAIGDVVVAKNLDEDFKPIDPTSDYTTDDTFYISVEVKDLVVGSVVEVKYKLEGEPYEESSLTADEAGSGYYGYKLRPNPSHFPGSYTAEVYLDGELVETVSFDVKASGPPEIGEVVMAKNLDADNKPVDPTTTYAPTDVFYVSVQVKNLVAGTVVQVQYKLDGEPYEDTSLTADEFGSGYYGFELTPADSHLTGDYTAEIYLDGVLVETVSFTVEE